MAVERYRVSVPETKIQDLKTRLSNVAFPDELSDSDWDLGAPLADIQRLAEYWREKFDWREAEANINRMPHFNATIQADGFKPLKIHFIHQKSEVANAIPLLFCHGWPGSFLEVEKLLPLLANSKGECEPAFHVVAPSLPNFGFSEGTKQRGFGLSQYAETLHKLMHTLGYDEYVTQGGDWGMMITRTMGIMYPQHVRASHINMVRTHPPSFLRNPLLALKYALRPFSARDRSALARTQWFLGEASGYRAQQSTKPQTLSYALTDSPVGLLAWIYEKLHDWTDSYAWTDDQILTWVSLYWFSSAGPGASLRIYFEATHPPKDSSGRSAFVHRNRTESWVGSVKLGLAHFPKELTPVPCMWTGTMGPVVYQSNNPHGGHFAATEHPGVIVRDLHNMFGKQGGAYGCVKNRDGYAAF